jgi:hypothetical protein
MIREKKQPEEAAATEVMSPASVPEQTAAISTPVVPPPTPAAEKPPVYVIAKGYSISVKGGNVLRAGDVVDPRFFSAADFDLHRSKERIVPKAI